MTGKKRYAKLPVYAVACYVLVTVLCIGELFANWNGGRMGSMANGMKAAWYGVIGLGFTIVTFGILLFKRSHLHHWLISVTALCIWLAVMGSIFDREIRYATDPGSFGSYGYDFRNKSQDWIGGDLVGTSADGRTVILAMVNMEPNERPRGGVSTVAQPPERLPRQVHIVWWKGKRDQRPADPKLLNETTLVWPCSFDKNRTVVFNYMGNGKWTTSVQAWPALPK